MLVAKGEEPHLKAWLMNKLPEVFVPSHSCAIPRLPRPGGWKEEDCLAFRSEANMNHAVLIRSDTETDILAEYVVALLASQEGDASQIRAGCESELPPFLNPGPSLEIPSFPFLNVFPLVSVEVFP